MGIHKHVPNRLRLRLWLASWLIYMLYLKSQWIVSTVYDRSFIVFFLFFHFILHSSTIIIFVPLFLWFMYTRYTLLRVSLDKCVYNMKLWRRRKIIIYTVHWFKIMVWHFNIIPCAMCCAHIKIDFIKTQWWNEWIAVIN